MRLFVALELDEKAQALLADYQWRLAGLDRAVRWVRPEQIHLTPREFALLEYLARRVGKVVTRTDIWEHVYDFHAEASSNVVDVYIGYLRRKIECEGKPALIRTLRGRGYSLGSPT